MLRFRGYKVARPLPGCCRGIFGEILDPRRLLAKFPVSILRKQFSRSQGRSSTMICLEIRPEGTHNRKDEKRRTETSARQKNTLCASLCSGKAQSYQSSPTALPTPIHAQVASVEPQQASQRDLPRRGKCHVSTPFTHSPHFLCTQWATVLSLCAKFKHQTGAPPAPRRLVPRGIKWDQPTQGLPRRMEPLWTSKYAVPPPGTPGEAPR